MRNDINLRRDVLDELEWEPGVDAAHIGVTACDGVITLTGAVKSYCEKLAAERVVKRVRGVSAIANDIDVRLPGIAERTDSDIARAAVEALKWGTPVPEGRVKVSVSKGWITLEGEVDWQYHKDAAFEAVHRLRGVKGVTTLIVVKPLASATEVTSRIEAAFRRSAELDAHKVRVETRDGKVTLRGDLRSWSERQEAERTARAAPGVTNVENLIVVTP
ncbi:MAG TPA: BON domain-containing protein [Isosphaeraceae bacterium]|nr:BON domain-containing protein [Isosphaeraceae bacterium]